VHDGLIELSRGDQPGGQQHDRQQPRLGGERGC
jgi:hypothetical protein